MADEGLHEIQLNGKQLVFLFMASTVVAVVIFLCGVMVGRGVRVQRPAIEATAEAATDPTAVAAPVTPPVSPPAVTSSAPVAAQETLTYPSRLEGEGPPEERLKPGSGIRDPGSATREPRPATTAAKTPSVAPKPANVATKAVTDRKLDRRGVPSGAPDAPPAARTQPAGNGFVVQVAAVNDRREAERIATRLAGKGYPSFVTTPPNSAAPTFRVRVGKYSTRREAEAIATRLQKEDQFKPWITR